MKNAANGAKSAAEAMRKTLNLPKTPFPMRANASKREPNLHSLCVTDIISFLAKPNPKKPTFVLHDGPPFANGELHMGHFMNKVLKDIIIRFKLLQGYNIQYIPGWDCHGLPIELKALETASHALSPSIIRTRSRALAQCAIISQRNDFSRWGILADWNKTYSTMDVHYELHQYDVLKRMVQKNLIYRGFKPVYYSPSSKTALAESELEYKDNHISQAAYITFPLIHPHSPTLYKLSQVHPHISLIAWTTTPWTIPANTALCIQSKATYTLVQSHSAHFVLAQSLIDSFSRSISEPIEILATFPGHELLYSRCLHPLRDTHVAVIQGEHVTEDAGTGIVHTAPAHGLEDYVAYMSYCTETKSRMIVESVVDEDGRFTADGGLGLEGLEVLKDGNERVLELLRKRNRLLHAYRYSHRYPYDWRTKKPVIMRATAQWFAKLESLHEVARMCLEENVCTHPSHSRNRLKSTLMTRNEWCISRQRAWGLVIPAFIHKATGEMLMNERTIEHFQDVLRERQMSGQETFIGSDYWYQLPVKDLLPKEYASIADEYEKGMDTLDVWFDSGCSWYAVLDKNADGKKQADVYLEGSDQHRGWFQSSLLTSVAMQNVAPYKMLITHGFILDENGGKQSKSLGNCVFPSDFIDGKAKNLSQYPAYGVDVLRYWVATCDYTSDVSVGSRIIQKASEGIRKLRNTARFLLGNLYDFSQSEAYDSLLPIDKYMLHILRTVDIRIEAAYAAYGFQRVHQLMSHFITNDISSFYLEICKNRLYCDGESSHSRRSCQTVLHHILKFVCRVMAPVTCYTAQDIYMHYKAQLLHCKPSDVKESVFTDTEFCYNTKVMEQWENDTLAREWESLRKIRREVNRYFESIREKNDGLSLLECCLTLNPTDERVSAALRMKVQTDPAMLEDFFLCSRVEVGNEFLIEVEDGNECGIGGGVMVQWEDESDVHVHANVIRLNCARCIRCWKYAVELDGEEECCARCLAVLKESGASV